MSTNRAELKKAPILRRLNLPPPRFCLHCGEYDTMVEIDNQLAGMKTVVSIHGAARVGVPVHACALCNFANVPAVMDYTGATITSNRGVVELARGWGWHAAATGGGQFVCGSPIEPDVLVCSNLCKLGTSLLMKGLSSCVWRARNWECGVITSPVQRHCSGARSRRVKSTVVASISMRCGRLANSYIARLHQPAERPLKWQPPGLRVQLARGAPVV